MSISRKNWMASLARQWTLEDEEEVERERRRRVRSSRSSSSTADPDSPGPGSPSGDAPARCSPPPEKAQAHGSAEPENEDFVELVRGRDERRRVRQEETLRRQRAEGEGEGGDGGRRARVEPPGDAGAKDGEGAAAGGRLAAGSTQPGSQGAPSASCSTIPPTGGTADRQRGNGESRGRVPEENPSFSSSRKFVSSVSISLDNCTSPTEKSPHARTFSPTPPASPGRPWGSPCRSPSPRGAQSPVQNGFTTEAAVSSSPSNPRAPFARQSSRTTSFRMLKKKEGETAPLRRSSSVRLTSRKFEVSNADSNQEEEKTSHFQRNTRQRISSRSIQEKMERLAQAAQKLEVSRSPDVTQRTLVLLEEVSRKRDLFEKDHQASAPSSPGHRSRQESPVFTSGISDRINRWVNRTARPSSSPLPTDLRHVDISSKKILFEGKQKE